MHIPKQYNTYIRYEKRFGAVQKTRIPKPCMLVNGRRLRFGAVQKHIYKNTDYVHLFCPPGLELYNVHIPKD